MKITVYNCRPFDELDNFKKMEKETGVEIVCCPDAGVKGNQNRRRRKGFPKGRRFSES